LRTNNTPSCCDKKTRSKRKEKKENQEFHTKGDGEEQ
jgi:hypothetical protein